MAGDLIMVAISYSDWDSFWDSGDTVGGVDGAARLHSALSPTLGGEGSYCRDFDGGGGQAIHHLFGLNSAFQAGVYHQIPNTKAISVRAWMRGIDQVTGGNAHYAGICAKTGTNALGGGGPAGYSLILQSKAPTLNAQNTLYLRTADENNAGAQQNTILTSMAGSTWFKLRMDVVPVGVSQDIIRVYTGTGATGSEVWNQEAEFNILSSAGNYAPWASAANPYVGFWRGCPGSFSDARPMYIDRFQVLLKDV